MRTEKRVCNVALEEKGHTEVFDKKDIRILYEFNRDTRKMTGFLVAYFPDPSYNQQLYRVYSCDFGNCNSDWDEWTLTDVLVKVFVSLHVPFNLREKILLELCKVKEWRPEIAHWWYINFYPHK
jgi:hypothetical protein